MFSACRPDLYPVANAYRMARRHAEGKGGHGGPKTAQGCEKRDQIGAQLKRRGCLYQEDGDWWKCPRWLKNPIGCGRFRR